MKNIRKVSLLLVIIAIISALLCSCGKDDSEAEMGWKKISDDGVSYNFFVPDEWTADITTGVTTAYVSGVDTSNVSMMSFVLPGREVQSIDDYWKLYEPELSAMFTDLEYELNGEDTTLDEVAAKKYVYTGTFSQTEYKIMQVVTIKNGEVYIFTYTAAAENYDLHENYVKDILRFFKFK